LPKLKIPSNYGWVILAVCLLFIALSYGIRMSYGVFFQPLEDEFQWSRALTSGVFSVYMLVGAIFAVLGGWIADRYGAKIVFIAMGIAAFAGLALTSRVTSLWQIFLSYSLLFGAGTGATYVLATSLTTRWFQKSRGLALGICTSGVGLGSIIIPPLASYLIGRFDWRYAFLVLGIIALLFIPLSFFLKRTPAEISEASQNKLPDKGTAKSGPKLPQPKGFSLRQAAKTRNFRLLIVTWFFFSFCIFTVSTHLVRHALDMGINPLQAASLISIVGATNILGRLSGGAMADRWGRRPVSLISAAFMLVSFVWLTQCSTIWMLYVFSAAFGASYGCLSPATTSIVGDTFGVRNIGTIFGILEVGWVLGAATGPALAGYIFDTFGSYLLGFWFGALASLIIIILILFLKIPETVKKTSLARQGSPD
jgi:MFS family permease